MGGGERGKEEGRILTDYISTLTPIRLASGVSDRES